MAGELPTDAGRLVARVDARWDAADVERALGRLHRERRRRRVRLALGAATLAAAVLLGLATSGPSGEGTSARGVGGPSVIELADGSRIEQSEDGAAIVEEVSDTHVAVRAERGSIRCDVAPRPERRFEVRAGDVTVTVLGTRFTVEPLPAGRARVAVERGRVGVAWPGGSTELAAGDAGTYPEAVAAAPEPALADEPAASPGDPAEVVEPSVRPLAERDEARDPRDETERDRGDWRSLARAERYDDAFVSLAGDDGRVDRVEDLLLAADVARISGHPSAALPYLDRVLREHADDARAPVASFTRGRVLAQLGRHREAAAELERAHRLEPGGSLAEDALGRAAIEHHAAGEVDDARRVAASYLTAHPGGRWAARLRPLAEASTP